MEQNNIHAKESDSMVDARGQSCPIPVLMTKKALQAANNPLTLDVLVDNVCAMENVSRYAGSQGYQVTVDIYEPDERLVRLKKK